MSRVDGKQKIIQYLADAHAAELAQISTLRAHINITEPGSYRQGLEAHLRDTQEHAQRVQRRLRDLGYQRNPLQLGFGLFQTIVGQTVVIAKGPIDMLRGGDRNEKMLRNARDEITSEALEIATYDAIERMANNLGDEITAELAASIRADEERMLDLLREELPGLTDQLVRSQIPAEQRAAAVSEDDVPIPRYNSLTADEITSRLPNLSQQDLRKVETYERSNQGRKTILDRVESLRAEEPWPGYDDQSVQDITKALGDAPDNLVQKVRDYERSHKNRSSILKATERERSNA